jgi:hypothetical protein
MDEGSRKHAASSRGAAIDGRRLVALALPVVLPPVMSAVFAAGNRRFGERAWRTGSLRWVAVSHALTDGSGLRNAPFFLG